MSIVLITLAASSPWIVGIAWYARRIPRDGWVAPSTGERLRRALVR